MASSGEIEFWPCHEYDGVPMTGIISPSMPPVHIIENKTYGNFVYCTVNEEQGKVLRYGAFSDEVISKLKWIEEEYYPALKKTLAISEGIDLKAIIAQALHMGDECHNRNKAATDVSFKKIDLHF